MKAWAGVLGVLALFAGCGSPGPAGSSPKEVPSGSPEILSRHVLKQFVVQGSAAEVAAHIKDTARKLGLNLDRSVSQLDAGLRVHCAESCEVTLAN